MATKEPVRVGFLSLTDAAPLVAAQSRGLFASAGIVVRLHREVGWATVYAKLLHGELDAAQAPAPMLWSAELGLTGPRFSACAPMILNLHGNAITLSTALRKIGVTDAATLRTEALRRRGERRLTFGVVHLFSSHHLLLRSWLKSARLVPGRDVRIAVVPPAQMFRNLAAGTIDGYCVGEPWNTQAVKAQIGWCPAVSALLHPGHVEKVLMTRTAFVESRPADLGALIAAVSAACAWCDRRENRPELARLLAGPKYLNVPADLITPALLGRFETGAGRAEIPDFHVFYAGGANIPTEARAADLQKELVAAGLVPHSKSIADLPHRLFREDLYRASAR